MASGKPAVSFIGLGAMGFGMATHLLKEGYDVTGFDVWAPTLERFQQAGGKTSIKPGEAVVGKDYCIFMVATAQQAQSVLFDGENSVATALPQGATLLLCSTVPCAYVQGLEKELAEKGRGDIHLIDCPVSGGAGRAADGTLSIMAGGSDAAIAKGRELLQAMSDPQKLYLVKGGIGAGSNMKMCHQVLAANQILSTSEAMGFASHLGLDLAKSIETILKSDGWSWMFEHRSPRILTDFKPIASAVNIIIKDTGIITSEARRAGFPSPMTSTAEQVYFAALGRGFGPDDDSSLIRLYTDGVAKGGGTTQGLVQSDEQKLALVISLLKGIHLCSAAETLAFANRVGLDLAQVYELCMNAAGGSKMLAFVGADIMKAFSGGLAAQGWASQDGADLRSIASEMEAVLEEAQARKVPLFLGAQALNLIRLALLRSSKSNTSLSIGSVVSVWAA